MSETNENKEPVAVGSDSNEWLGALLPDDFSESKDWKAAGVVERIEWLKFFNKFHMQEIDRLETQLIEIIEQLEQTQIRSEQYRWALVKIVENHYLSGSSVDTLADIARDGLDA